MFFFSSRRRHTRCSRDWSSDVCSSDLSCDSLGSFSCPRGIRAGILCDFFGDAGSALLSVFRGVSYAVSVGSAFPMVEMAGSGLWRSEEHTSELQSRLHLVCRLLLEKKNITYTYYLPPRATERRHRITTPLAPLRALLNHKYYVDDLYGAVILRPSLSLATPAVPSDP